MTHAAIAAIEAAAKGAEAQGRMKNTAATFETIAALLIAWGIVFLAPRKSAYRRLRAINPTASSQGEAAILGEARAVAARVARTASRLPLRTTCLVQALAGALLLRRRNIGGTVVRLGVRKMNGRFEAHAWLLCYDAILLGGENSESQFTPIAEMQMNNVVDR